MASGLRVWDASGNLIVDTTTRLGTVLGTVTTTKANGSITNAGFAQGTPFYSVCGITDAYSVFSPKITLSGNTMSWAFNTSGANSNTSQFIVYGVY